MRRVTSRSLPPRTRPPSQRTRVDRDLARLETLRWTFGGEAARERRALAARLLRARLASAARVLRLHELLLAARAYPDDAATLALAKRALAGFGARADVRRQRDEL